MAIEDTLAIPKHELNLSEQGFEKPINLIPSFGPSVLADAATIFGKWQLKVED
jgi:hypothetical protein